MSFDVSWDIEKYREDHESDEHWQLRRNFMERWQQSYPEERLVCLARVFANMEFMGCRYPQEVMQEVARMSKEVNKEITCNNNFANLSSFDGQHVAQDTESAATNVIESTKQQLDSNNYNKNQDSSKNQYVWRSYTREVMQGPVSIAKVLRTEHLKSFIRENSPNFRTGSSSNKFPRTEMSPQSNLSEFIDDSIDAVNSYQHPRNATRYQKASDSVPWAFRDPTTKNHTIQDGPMIPQNGGIDQNWYSTDQIGGWQYQNTSQACNNHMFNYTATSSVPLIQEKEIQSGKSIESTYFGGNSYQQDQTISYIDGSMLENQGRKEYWSSTGLKNSRKPTINQSNIAANVSNIDAYQQDKTRSYKDDSTLGKQGQNYWSQPVNSSTSLTIPQKPTTNQSNIDANVSNISAYQQDETRSFIDGSTLLKQGQNYWSQAVDSSTGLTNPQKPTTNQSNIGACVSNIGASTSNIVTSINASYAACNVDAYNNVSVAVSNTNSTSNVTTVSNTVPVSIVSNVDEGVGKNSDKQKPYKKRCGAAVKRYRFWLHAGKSEREAVRLSSVKLSRVPEYKELKKTLGSVKHHYKLTKNEMIAQTFKKGPPSANTRNVHQRTKKDNAYTSFVNKIKSFNQKNLKGGQKNKVGKDPINKAVNVICNTATLSKTSLSKTLNTSDIPASASNIDVSTSNTNAENSISTQISENLCNPVSDITPLTNEAKSTNRKSRKDNWLETKQNKNCMESISHVPPIELPLVKQLKAKTKATMLKLAQKDNFKQRLINTYNQHSLNAESNTNVIEISDDEADTENNRANEKEVNKKEMQENRNLCIQQGKAANSFCQKPMAVSDVEKIPGHQDVLKELQGKNLHIEVNETQRYVTDVSHNNRADIPEIDILHGNIRSYNELNVEYQTEKATNGANSEHIEYTVNLANTGNSEYNVNATTDNNNRDYISNAVNTVNFANTEYTKAIAPNINTVLTVNTPIRAKNVNEYKIYVKDAKKEIYKEEQMQLQNAIAECISENDEVKFLRVNRLSTCAVVKCGDEYSRDWLDKQIPTLMPWEGAELMIINESDMPVFFNAWIYVPAVPEISTVIKPEEVLKKLHDQNKKIGCDKWKVLNTQIEGEGRLFLVRFESKFEMILQKRGYKLNWFSARPLKVNVKRKIKELNNKNANTKRKKKLLRTKTVINPFNQKKLTTNPKNKKIAKNPNTKTANILSNETVKDSAPVITVCDEDGFGGNQHEENSYVNKKETNTPVVFVSAMGNEENLNPFGTSNCSHYPTHGDYSQPSSSHLSGTHRNDQSSTSNEYSSTVAFDHQTKLIPLDDTRQVSAEKRIVSKSLTVQIANDIREENNNVGENRSSAVDSMTDDNRVQATEAWGIDTPRMLSGHLSALKLRTDLWDCDDPREKNNFIKIGSSDQKKYSDEDRDYNFLDVFTGRDEEFSLEERVFAAQKTLVRDNREITRDDRILERDEEYLGNRNYSSRDFLGEKDFCERGSVSSSKNITEEESRRRYSQEDFNGQTQKYSFDEITTSDYKNSRRSEYSREDNTYGRRENYQEDYVMYEKERYISVEDTDMDEEYHSQQECQERDWDERRQGYSCEDRDLEGWSQDYFRTNSQRQQYHDNMYPSEDRYHENRSAERGDRVHSRKGRYFDRTDEYFRNRDYQKDRSRSAHSREFLAVEDRAGPRRDTDSRRSREPDKSRHYLDSRSDCNVDDLKEKYKRRARRKEFKL